MNNEQVATETKGVTVKLLATAGRNKHPHSDIVVIRFSDKEAINGWY